MKAPHKNTMILALGLILVGSVIYCEPLRAQDSATTPKSGDVAFWEELAFWEAIKDSNDPAEYRAYLAAYPNGRFTHIAQIRIQALSRSQDPQLPGTGPATEAATDRSEQAAPKPGDRFRDCDECPEIVVIPAGSYYMGSERSLPQEKPRREVKIDRPFGIGISEVTIREWDMCLREGGCNMPPEAVTNDRLPMSNVSWDDAQRFVRWLSEKTGREYRLPTEAEWEYAAGAGTATPFWWGKEVGEGNANCSDCGTTPAGSPTGEGPLPVGSFKPNPFGLYDVHGNLWEWTLDCANPSYEGAPSDGKAQLRGDCIRRVLRGGSWKLDSKYMRTTRRNQYDRDVRYYLHGFRVVRTLP